jgi:tetratricopeptide (TPR) repeat protein
MRPYRHAPSGNTRGAGYGLTSAISLALFGLALLSKENGVTFIGVIIIYYLLFQREWGPQRDVGGPKPPFAGYLAGCLLLTSLYLVVRYLWLGQILVTDINFMENPLAFEPLYPRLLTASKILGKSVYLLVFPWKLTIDYSYNQVPVSRALLDIRVLFPALTTLLLFTAAFLFRRRWREALFALLFFLATYSITSNVLVSTSSIMAERFLYLPSLAFALVLGILYQRAWDSARNRGWKLALTALLCAQLAFYSYRTVTRNRDWRSNYTLFASAARASPRSAKAHIALAINRQNAGFLDDAIAGYKRALEIKPDAIDARNNLGVAYGQKGLLDEAIRELKKAVAIDPTDALSHKNLGLAYKKKGMTAEARREFAAYRMLTESPH